MNKLQLENNDVSKLFLTDGIDLKKIIQELYQQKWIIIAVYVITAIIAWIYTFSIQPLYQTTGIIQIHSQTKSNSLFNQLYRSMEGTEIDTQEALIKTRYILEPVIEQTNLNIITSSHYFPVIGVWLARHYHGNDLAKPFLGMKQYAWGGETLEIKQFWVPPEYIGHVFKLVAIQSNMYRLYSNKGDLVLTGKVGFSSISKSNNYNGLKIELQTLHARPGTQFFIRYTPPLSLVRNLSRNIQITDIYGNDSTKNTGILQIKLTDSNPKRVVYLLNTLMHYIITKDIEQNIQELQSTQSFVQNKLKEYKNNLYNSENILNQYHIKNTTIDMTMISHTLQHTLSKLEQELESLQSNTQALLQIYTPLHPLVIASLNKEHDIQKRLTEIKEEIKKFPVVNQVEYNLMRDVKIKNSIYINLLTHQEQLILRHGNIFSNIKILSEATPPSMLSSNKLLKILMGFLIGTFLSSFLIILKNALNKTIQNAEQLEDVFQAPVQCIVPFSMKQKQLEKSFKKTITTLESGLTSVPLILASQKPEDITIENLRSLRVSLNILSSATTQSTTIAIMGNVSGVGKSFISLNLSQVFADSGKRTLLIDADLRKGHLHRELHQSKYKGLSEFLEGNHDYVNLIRSIHRNLFFIPCGKYTTHPLQLLQSPELKDLLIWTKNEFDHVIIDCSPILPVIDSILVAQHCNTKLFVVSACKDNISDVTQAVKKARSHGVEINGFILNHTKPTFSYSHDYYSYGEKQTV